MAVARMRGANLARVAACAAMALSFCGVAVTAQARPPEPTVEPTPTRPNFSGRVTSPGNAATSRPPATAKHLAPPTAASTSHGRPTAPTHAVSTNTHAGVLGGPARSTGFKTATNPAAIPGAVSGTGLKRRPGSPAH